MTTVYPDVFNPTDVETQLRRLDALTPDTPPQWGRMNAAAMLAHLNVSYEMVYDGTHPQPNALVRLLLRLFVKQGVVGPTPYKRNTPTAPAFRIAGPRDFEREKARLVAYMRRVLSEGRAAFEGRASLSFGPLTADEWQVLFGKHLDHHLQQFGV
jgi:hypothetical protein